MATAYTAPESGTYVVSCIAPITTGGLNNALVTVYVTVNGSRVRLLDRKLLQLTTLDPQTVGGSVSLVLVTDDEVDIEIINEDPTNSFEIVSGNIQDAACLSIYKVGESV